MMEAQYVKMLQSLLPRGKMWDSFYDQDTNEFAFLRAVSDELVRMDGRVSDFLREVDPNQTNELLSAWEQMLGIPNTCLLNSGTLTQRRNQLLLILTDRGGQSRQYFIDLAAKLGFTVSITEFKPFVAGSCAGDSLTNGVWAFAWQVNAPLNTVSYFSAGQNAAGDPLAVWGNGELECMITQRAPAQTKVLFSYT